MDPASLVGSRVHVRLVDTPVGKMMAGATDAGLCLFEFTEPERLEPQMEALGTRLGSTVTDGDHPHIQTAEQEVERYFDGQLRQFTVPLDAPGTDFEMRVWNQLLRIPYGETCSYLELARRVGNPAAVRAVGRANGRNRIAIIIPCHRVVNANGQLGGYGGGLWRKRQLLQLEWAGTLEALAAVGGR
jgi:AraC family transcriptional regulator of adaptative response/methylated-DNA-[protein]-cysteine methyltransferase